MVLGKGISSWSWVVTEGGGRCERHGRRTLKEHPKRRNWWANALTTHARYDQGRMHGQHRHVNYPYVGHQKKQETAIRKGVFVANSSVGGVGAHSGI